MRHAAIFLPGIVTPAELAYGDLRNALGHDREVVLRDLAVYDAAAPPAGYGLDTEVSALLRAADELEYERFHLAGYSAGGAIAAAFAARFPDRLASLALMEPAWFGNEGLSKAEKAVFEEVEAAMALPMEQAMPEFVRLNLAEGVRPPPPPPGEAPAWMASRPAAIRATARAFGSYDLDLAALGRFARPVLYLRCDLSNPVLYEPREERARGLFSDFTSVLFRDRHHFDPPHRAEPERTARLLRAFWDRAETEKSG
jgi:pimeloyl-ACP methyl ester carboxylesterase